MKLNLFLTLNMRTKKFFLQANKGCHKEKGRHQDKQELSQDLCSKKQLKP